MKSCCRAAAKIKKFIDITPDEPFDPHVQLTRVSMNQALTEVFDDDCGCHRELRARLIGLRVYWQAVVDGCSGS